MRIRAVVFAAALILGANPGLSERLAPSGKPPRSPHVPMVRIPLADWRYVDDEVRASLARCVQGRPVCETGMACFGWIQIGLVIGENGQPRDLRTLSSCLLEPEPPVPWSELLGLRFNPRIRNGRPVAVNSWIVLAQPLGVSS